MAFADYAVMTTMTTMIRPELALCAGVMVFQYNWSSLCHCKFHLENYCRYV